MKKFSEYVSESGYRVSKDYILKITLSYDSEVEYKNGDDPQFVAINAFLDKIPERYGPATLDDCRVIGGMVNSDGVEVPTLAKDKALVQKLVR